MITAKIGDKNINCYDNCIDEKLLREWCKKKIVVCPVCGKPYEYCHGLINSPYFRHLDKKECKKIYSEPETEEHINGKIALFNWVKKQSGVKDVKIESWIPETKQRPDISFKYNGKQYVIEYQCSPISSEYLERHELYQIAGINDIWILGHKKYYYNGKKLIEKISKVHFDSKNGCFVIAGKPIELALPYSNLAINQNEYHIFSPTKVVFVDNEIQVVPDAILELVNKSIMIYNKKIDRQSHYKQAKELCEIFNLLCKKNNTEFTIKFYENGYWGTFYIYNKHSFVAKIVSSKDNVSLYSRGAYNNCLKIFKYNKEQSYHCLEFKEFILSVQKLIVYSVDKYLEYKYCLQAGGLN